MKHTDALAALDELADTDLLPSARAVFLVLAVHTDDNGLCWPSVERLAAIVGLAAANVRRHLLTLSAVGLIDIMRGGGRGHTNLYRLRVEVVPNPRASARVSDDETRAESARNPRASARKPARWRAMNEEERIGTGGDTPPDPPRDAHDDHRPGDCAECDAGLRTLVARYHVGPLLDQPPKENR